MQLPALSQHLLWAARHHRRDTGSQSTVLVPEKALRPGEGDDSRTGVGDMKMRVSSGSCGATQWRLRYPYRLRGGVCQPHPECMGLIRNAVVPDAIDGCPQ